MSEMMTVDEAAAFLAVKPVTVRKLVNEGTIKATRLNGPGMKGIRIQARDLYGVYGTEEPLLHAEEVAAILGVAMGTVIRWARAGRLRSVKVSSWRTVRFRRSDVERFIAGSAQ